MAAVDRPGGNREGVERGATFLGRTLSASLAYPGEVHRGFVIVQSLEVL